MKHDNPLLESYARWIIANVPRNPYEVAGTCLKVSKKMNLAFPELIIKKGAVSSHQNPDNLGTMVKEYPHVWLETRDGTVIDPTSHQFLFKELKYREFEGDVEKYKKCMGCGTYSMKGVVCSKECEEEMMG